MIIYHVNDPDFSYGNKAKGTWADVERFWGNIVTNKALRTEAQFAVLFETRGGWLSHLSHHDFEWFRSHCTHEYISQKPLSAAEFDKLVAEVPRMSSKQLLQFEQLARTVWHRGVVCRKEKLCPRSAHFGRSGCKTCTYIEPTATKNPHPVGCPCGACAMA